MNTSDGSITTPQVPPKTAGAGVSSSTVTNPSTVSTIGGGGGGGGNTTKKGTEEDGKRSHNSSAQQQQANNNNANSSGTVGLVLSQSPTDGSLLTVPLRTVVGAMTHTLYQDLYTMATGSEEGDDDVTEGPQKEGGDGTHSTSTTSTTDNKKKSKKIMATLSFAARRHELSIRLYRHLHAASHVTALVATYSSLISSSPTDWVVQTCSDAFSETFIQTRCGQDEAQDALYFHHAELWKVRRHPHDILGSAQLLIQGSWKDFPTDTQLLTSKEELIARDNGTFCRSCSTRSTQQQPLESPSLTTQPSSVVLVFTKEETLARLQSCVRRKLLLGEVGQARKEEYQRKKEQPPRSHRRQEWWDIVLESNGCAIRLHHGTKHSSSSTYPIEARLTVLDYEDETAPWTLLSLDIHAHPKTGESSHQLEPNNKQKYNLHRICEKVMKVEEEKQQQQAKPLDALFYVAHKFALSLQLEILSAQAEALRRGTWEMISSSSLDASSSSSSSKDALERYRTLHVSPIQYIMKSQPKVGEKRKRKEDSEVHDDEEEITAIMAIHFWYVDDRYGIPKVRDVSFEDEEDTFSAKKINNNYGHTFHLLQYNVDGNNTPTTISQQPQQQHNIQSRFAMYIRAIPRKGLVVSLPGGEIIRKCLLPTTSTAFNGHSSSSSSNSSSATYDKNFKFLKRYLDKLKSSVHNPFSLSAADAILAATSICAHLKCITVVEALTKSKATNVPSSSSESTPLLPLWMKCTMDAGTITIAVKISYNSSNHPVVEATSSGFGEVPLFRVNCDTRTGQFVPVFSSSTSLLRSCACHDLSISRNAMELYNLHHLHQTSAPAVPTVSDNTSWKKPSSSSSQGLKARRSRTTTAVVKDLTGHIVRDAFEGLVRSMDNLSHKAGVGEDQWDDYDVCHGSGIGNSTGTTNAKLRANAVRAACVEVKQSLMACCGLAAIYGIGGSALSLASGANAMIDMAGGIITEDVSSPQVPSPPVCVILNQNIYEEKAEINSGIDEPKQILILEREGLAVSGSVNAEHLQLSCFSFQTESTCDSSVPVRISCLPVDLPPPAGLDENHVTGSDETDPIVHDSQAKCLLGLEIGYFADRLFQYISKGPAQT